MLNLEEFLKIFFLAMPWGCVCGILVPLPGIEPSPSALEVWSLNHWTMKEGPRRIFKDVLAGRYILGLPWWLSW